MLNQPILVSVDIPSRQEVQHYLKGMTVTVDEISESVDISNQYIGGFRKFFPRMILHCDTLIDGFSFLLLILIFVIAFVTTAYVVGILNWCHSCIGCSD